MIISVLSLSGSPKVLNTIFKLTEQITGPKTLKVYDEELKYCYPFVMKSFVSYCQNQNKKITITQEYGSLKLYK